MPELPEVEVVRRGLESHVVGRGFADVRITGERAARRHPYGREHLAELLTGTQVVAADRRGKYLWLVLCGGPARHDEREQRDDHGTGDLFALVVHLGMSGQMLVESGQAPLEKHAHAVFGLSEPVSDASDISDASGETGRQLRFVDQRTFGGLSVAELSQPAVGHPYGVPASIAHIAPDPLEEGFDERATVRRIRDSSSGIKRSLLNQNLVSGIGNIYADESLWRAGIHGERPGAALTAPAVGRLLSHVRDVMSESLEAGGTSFDSLYVNVNGASGYFSRSLDAYGREGRPCRRCGRPIRRETFMNRSSFSCPGCQRRPRLRITG